jgi:hypothetical protein
MLSTMAGLKVTPDFVIYHRYPEWGPDCDFTLLIGNLGWIADMADIRQQLKDYLGSANTKAELMCTENNCDSTWQEGKQMCSLVDGLYMADSFGTVLQTECNSYLWWDLINGQYSTGDNGSWLYGWREYGDEGVMSPDFTLTYPTYYVEQLLNDFAAPGDQVLPTASPYNLLDVFTTQRSDGSVRVLVVNKNATSPVTAQFVFTGFEPAGPATLYRYGMDQDNAAENGKSQAIAVSTVKSASNKMTQVFPPYSISVFVFNNR